AQMGPQAGAVRARMAKELGLADPGATWHTQRDEWVALGCELGLLTGSLGKIAVDVSLLGQYEVAEVAEPSEPGRGGSSAMPHKRNPVAS
ncbi:lyase family protein, partial [Variovorax sp. CT11-76]